MAKKSNAAPVTSSVAFATAQIRWRVGLHPLDTGRARFNSFALRNEFRKYEVLSRRECLSFARVGDLFWAIHRPNSRRRAICRAQGAGI